MSRRPVSALTLLLLCAVPALCAAAVVIPVELEDGNNFTTVRINGVKLKTVIDTGGWHAIGITPEAVARLHVHFTGTTTALADSAGGRYEGREFRIPSMQLGGVTFHDVLGFERRSAGAGDLDAAEFDAVIGSDFLEHYTVVVDYPRKRFELYPVASAHAVCGPVTATILPSEDGIMFSTIRTDSGVMNLGWDTGATYSVLQKAVATLRGLPLKDDFYSTRRFALEHFDAGGMDLVSVDMAGVPDLDGLIGFNFFEHHRVCFDYAGHAVSVRQARQE
jgi:Aspartyl protease